MDHLNSKTVEIDGKSTVTQKKLITDPAQFTTNRKLLLLSGILMGETWYDKVYSVFTALMMTSGVIHYFGKVVFGEEVNVINMMKSIHLAVTYLTAGLSGASAMLGSLYFRQCHLVIKSGFYTYYEPLTAQQIKVRAEANARATKMTKIICLVMICSISASIFKEPVPHDFKEWRKNYAGWFPIVINSWTKYIISQIYHLFLAMTIGVWSSAFLNLYITLSEHLLAQIEVLRMSIEDTFRLITEKSNYSKHEERIHNRIINCIEHHTKLMNFFAMFQRYYYVPLLTVIGGTTIVLCTMAYVITTSSDIGDIFGFITMLLPEIIVAFLYCVYGQNITNKTEELRDIIYGVPWYNHSKNVKLALLMMLIQTRNPFILSAGGLKNASLASFKELIQASFTYLNVLQAMA